MKDPEAATWVTDCPLAAVQFEQHAGQKPLHPMSLLARAYRGDAFPGAKDQKADDNADAKADQQKDENK
jgi:glycerol-3-phosphate dehydrogenase subunit C